MTSSDKEQSELRYQAERAARIDRIGPTPEHVIERYRNNRLWRLFPKEFMFKRLGNIARKEILDFGCGEGTVSTQLARLGGRVTAIDISPELIELAQRRADLDGVRNNITFIMGDVTESPFPKNKFDIVVCSEVLHHVDIRFVMPHLFACLKPGGVAIMMEPIAFSPSLQKLRDRVPVEKDASPDERQLNREDVNLILRFMVDSEIKFFNFLGRLSRLLPNANKIDKGHPFTKAALIYLWTLDRIFLAVCPPLKKFYGTVVIVGRKPAFREASDPASRMEKEAVMLGANGLVR